MFDVKWIVSEGTILFLTTDILYIFEKFSINIKLPGTSMYLQVLNQKVPLLLSGTEKYHYSYLSRGVDR